MAGEPMEYLRIGLMQPLPEPQTCYRELIEKLLPHTGNIVRGDLLEMIEHCDSIASRRAVLESKRKNMDARYRDESSDLARLMCDLQKDCKHLATTTIPAWAECDETITCDVCGADLTPEVGGYDG